jgi:hypothetical protein
MQATKLSALLLVGVTGLAALSGCRSDGATTTDSSSGGGPTSSSSGGTGGSGTGGSGGCKVATDCPGTDDDCQQRTCTAGVCDVSFTANGTPTTTQTTGDCQKSLCDGAGNASVVNDDTDPLVDGDPCTDDVCTAGVPSNPPAAAKTPCSSGTATMCDGAGHCVECLASTDCTSGICTANVCLSAVCSDNVKNGNETDVDCGGACLPCADGKVCAAAADCQSGVCSGTTTKTCQVPVCTDAAKNGTETDVDCGGGVCPKCAPLKKCSVNADCTGGQCSGSVCLATCTDAVKNGGETDVDCGGAACPKCVDGKVCTVNADCTNGKCTAGMCTAPSCTDLVKNGLETDVDCGGPMCGKCAVGKVCIASGDCQSSNCQAGMCAASTCTNVIKDGSETDVDCGGPSCPKCPLGKVCGVNGDCQGGNCASNVCTAPSCTDTIKDGTETGVDCGGGACPTCADGQGCMVNGDCTSGLCKAGVCATPTCTDTIKDGAETGVDCGGTCPACPSGQGCLVVTDCQSLVCSGNVCQAPSCTDVTKNGLETDVDCGGSGGCPKCIDGKTCLANGDCQSGSCGGGFCLAPTCADGVHNGGETDVDCGGACPGKCVDGKNCSVAGDCQSGVCAGGVCAAPGCTDGLKNGAETGIDCGGTCAACPIVSATTPADGATGVPVSSTIVVTFSTAMNASTLTAQTSSGTCSGSVQVSTDINFGACIGIGTLAPSGSPTVATLTPAPGLSFGSTYYVRVTTAAQDTKGNACAAYTSAGFTTTAPSATCSSTTSGVVISQVYGGGGGMNATYTTDFIELHNNGSTAVNIGGWSVQYQTQGASTWTATSIPAGKTIAPGGYFLIHMFTPANPTGSPLPTADATGATNLNSAQAKVALVNNSTTLSSQCPAGSMVDLVQWGTATQPCFEGTTFATAPTVNTSSLLRNGGGCTDTNQNAGNFAVGAVNPRNSASALNSCSAGCSLNESDLVLEADYCVLQSPTSLSVKTGTSTGTINGRLYESTITNPAGASAWIAQLGYGPDSVNPENQSGWTWFSASFDQQFGNDDQYAGSFTAPAVGTYRYTYRFSSDGVNWTYCEVNGAGSDPGFTFEVTQLPILTVTP